MSTPRVLPAAPLSIESVVDQVYEAIRERITSGSLPRGDRIHQEDLAEELGVSRTPVREALRRLAAEGLVEMRTNRGARVADVGRREMHAAYQARLVIEPGAARLAAKELLPGPLQQMRDALTAQRRAVPDVGKSFDANREFHLALVQASGNEYLMQFVQRLWVARIGAVIYERQTESTQQMRSDSDEHEEILREIESGNGKRAESLTRRHLLDAMRRSRDLLGNAQRDDDAELARLRR
jgi:DNA-binding GntR family transcriptional regulator